MKWINPILIIFFVASNFILGDSIKIEDYLKTRVIGMPIIYKHNGHYKQAEGINLIQIDNRYSVRLSTNDLADVLFNVNPFNGRSARDAVMENRQEREVQQQVLNAQHEINMTIRRATGDSDATGGAPLVIPDLSYNHVSNNQATMNIQELQNTEEILYTNLGSGEEKKGIAHATIDGIFLETGEFIQIYFRVND
jgi:hypothetical protein